MNAQMNLQTRGLMVAVIPFFFQMLFIGWLMVQLWQVQSEVVKTSQSREITSTAHMLVLDSMVKQIVPTLGDGVLEERDPNLDVRIARIRDLTSSDPNRSLLANKMLERMNDLLDLGRRAVAEKRFGEAHWIKVDEQYYRPMDLAGERFFEAATDLVTFEEQRYPFDSKAMRSRIDQVVSTSVLFVVISVIVSIVVGWFYARSIRAPLVHLKDNGQLLAKRQVLPPPLSGKDELSKLDQFLHEVSDSLDEAFLKEKELFNNAADMICALTEEVTFTNVNPSGERLLGFKSSELEGRSILEFVDGEDVVKADSELSMVKLSADTRIFEVRLKAAGSGSVDTRWSIRWSMSDHAIFCVVHDMTEEKNIEKLKEDFVDMVSHDLRSPLTSMLGSLFFITKGALGPVSNEVGLEVSTAHKNVQRLITFVNDFLDFQKLSAGQMVIQPGRVALREIFSETLASVGHLAEPKGIKLSVPQADVNLVCDKTKVIQVLANLLSNAIKFSPPGGEIHIFLARRSGTTLICVTDSGPGVPHALRQKIFEAFEQVPGESAREGTGLGLAICKLICDAHGWSIGVEGRDESALCDGQTREPGSVFWVSIPHSSAEAKGYVEERS
jgi:PAS domain S-box-containing protein